MNKFYNIPKIILWSIVLVWMIFGIKASLYLCESMWISDKSNSANVQPMDLGNDTGKI
jgi:hypothetical protein